MYSIPKIYSLYEDLFKNYCIYYLENEDEEKQLVIIHFLICVMQIVKFWCVKIEKSLPSDLGKPDSFKNMTLVEDLEEFDKKKNELRELMFKSYVFKI